MRCFCTEISCLCLFEVELHASYKWSILWITNESNLWTSVHTNLVTKDFWKCLLIQEHNEHFRKCTTDVDVKNETMSWYMLSVLSLQAHLCQPSLVVLIVRKLQMATQKDLNILLGAWERRTAVWLQSGAPEIKRQERVEWKREKVGEISFLHLLRENKLKIVYAIILLKDLKLSARV